MNIPYFSKKMNSGFRASLLVALFLMLNYELQAQVMVGQNSSPQNYSVLELSTAIKKGGLRLPQLSETEKLNLNVSGAALAKGLTIYNTTKQCIEYWNGSLWVSLCDGSSCSIAFNPTAVPEISEGGGTAGPIIATSSCCTQAGNYSFELLGNASYVSIINESPANGRFSVKFEENKTAEERIAIVKVTNPCGNVALYIVGQKARTCTAVTGVTLSTTPDPPVPGQTFTVKANVTGGLAPYNYEVYRDNNVAPIASGTSTLTTYDAYTESSTTLPGLHTYSIKVWSSGCTKADASEAILAVNLTPPPAPASGGNMYLGAGRNSFFSQAGSFPRQELKVGDKYRLWGYASGATSTPTYATSISIGTIYLYDINQGKGNSSGEFWSGNKLSGLLTANGNPNDIVAASIGYSAYNSSGTYLFVIDIVIPEKEDLNQGTINLTSTPRYTDEWSCRTNAGGSTTQIFACYKLN